MLTCSADVFSCVSYISLLLVDSSDSRLSSILDFSHVTCDSFLSLGLQLVDFSLLLVDSRFRLLSFLLDFGNGSFKLVSKTTPLLDVVTSIDVVADALADYNRERLCRLDIRRVTGVSSLEAEVRDIDHACCLESCRRHLDTDRRTCLLSCCTHAVAVRSHALEERVGASRRVCSPVQHQVSIDGDRVYISSTSICYVVVTLRAVHVECEVVLDSHYAAPPIDRLMNVFQNHPDTV